MDHAIEKAGTEYDALVDGVVTAHAFPSGYTVEGTPVNTRKMSASLGEEKFQKWAAENDLKYHSERKDSSKR